jgi:hypothetical protein
MGDHAADPGRHDEHRARARTATSWQAFRAARDAYFDRVSTAGEVERLERTWRLPAAPEPPVDPAG